LRYAIERNCGFGIKAQEQTFHHLWNKKSEITGVMLGRTLGLVRTGVNIGRIPPGKESFVYHAHHREEEWIYVLAGKGIAEIDDQEFEVEPGDFMAFPTPSVAHPMRNVCTEDLVYLFGGENLEYEIADFPKLGKRMLRRRQEIDVYDLADTKPFGPLEG
jgi:uncharacterized cupin superfamily protein